MNQNRLKERNESKFIFQPRKVLTSGSDASFFSDFSNWISVPMFQDLLYPSISQFCTRNTLCFYGTPGFPPRPFSFFAKYLDGPRFWKDFLIQRDTCEGITFSPIEAMRIGLRSHISGGKSSCTLARLLQRLSFGYCRLHSFSANLSCSMTLCTRSEKNA